MKMYTFADIEKKWQQHWQENKTFKALNPGDPGFDANKPKYYVLDMFPYPSGKGLHVGHPLGYIATDIVARYKRMQGFNVLHPMGFDAFGLPAEQYAIETGTHPEVTTQKNIDNMRRQLKDCALSYDWDREISTTDPEYYKWTQWIFLQLFNSYFDEQEQKAKPIKLLIENLKQDFQINWESLSEVEQENILSKYRLAYQAEVPVNWCPDLGTVLANEEVTNEGRSERGNYPVYKRPLKQWTLRITKYADRLIEDLEAVDWPLAVKEMQKNWIGKSTGAQVKFSIKDLDQSIDVFTTRPDTLMGCTFMVLAAQHPLLKDLVSNEKQDQLSSFIAECETLQANTGYDEDDKKIGMFTGAYATHPISGKNIPIWTANYVLMDYGTGAVMAVPAHDERDFAFAKQYNIDIKPVVEPDQAWLKKHHLNSVQDYQEQCAQLTECYSEYNKAFNSASEQLDINGLDSSAAKEKIITFLENKNLGFKKVQYKLRDWLFSRQRYWGEPFPILHKNNGVSVGVDKQDLPVVLPPLEDFRPTGGLSADEEPQPSLSRAEKTWKEVEKNGVHYQRELNTMPQWAGSCWYYLRFLDPKNTEQFASKEAQNYWMGDNGVDLYVGGVEHAVLHLLYARFWHKVLYDLGHVKTKEPFGKLFNQGYIQAYSYQDERGIYVNAHEVNEVKPGHYQYEGKLVQRNLGKMGKSLKNSISPDEMIEKYGCDTFRLYEMYLGPLDQSKVWDTEAIVGVHRFLQKLWRNLVNEETGELKVVQEEASKELTTQLHQCIKTVSEYMENMRYNAAIAQIIQLNNSLSAVKVVPQSVANAMLRMLAPMAPHICEELWSMLGHTKELSQETWPSYDEALIASQAIEIVIQVNGKKKSSIMVEKDTDAELIKQQAQADGKVVKNLQDKTVRKVIYVPGRLVNIVAN
ncbi:MAG TPA: leucine--tRNA ligase [Oligoflexia bacterium]|nr:leucine--tRNA ligase [Oligoflexia bacterium]HMR24197.1 leucine--tRNA ligase [Oligoflexia bacterium]